MCGIFGMVANQIRNGDAVVRSACAKLGHRGPDGSGIASKPPIIFGHRRLSIVDIQGGKQPMASSDSRYLITYNGEIYNHQQIRQQLRSAGYFFDTNSDTETLLYAFAAWGTDCLTKLKGMFAFAIADFQNRQVFLARDTFGIKPLCYRIEPGVFAFSSEIPPLADMSCFPAPTVNESSVSQFFRYQYISAPNSIYDNIYKLPPAHAMRVNFEGDIESIWRYKEYTFTPEIFDFDSAVSQTKTLVSDAVLSNTMSDVPVGVFLSGGIDSTLVAMNLVQNYDINIPAFTITFEENDFSELPYAKYAANHLGLKLTIESISNFSLESLPEILSFYGEPFGDSSALPTWHVAKLARQQVSVALSGDGGDELFGGYQSHAAWLLRSQENHFLRLIESLFTLRAKNFFHYLQLLLHRPQLSVNYWHQFIQYNSPKEIENLLTPPYAKHGNEMADGFKYMCDKEVNTQLLDFVQLLDMNTYLPECILAKVDIASMQHGLEVRPALLDSDLLEFALRLAPSCRFNNQYKGKAVLKQILLDSGFSKDFVFREKHGFSIPVDHWFLKGGKAYKLLKDLIYTYKTEAEQFLNLRYVEKLLSRHSLEKPCGSKLWLILAFLCWIANQKNIHYSDH